MEKIEATFRVVTPMFMSGAEQSEAELRLPSIKGALRFWWRALAWGRYGGDLRAIHEEENKLFGSTKAGQAAMLMKLEAGPLDALSTGQILEDNGRVVGEGARYLGYGVMEAFSSRRKGTRAGDLTRPCIKAPFEFTLHLCFKPQSSRCFKPHLSETSRKSVLDAVKLMGLAGGLGSKSRKGYGSLTLVNLTYKDSFWETPISIENLAEILSSFKNNAVFPEYSALSENTRILLIEGNTEDSALSLLDRIGRELVFYRSWGNRRGQQHVVLNAQRAEQNFSDDHNLMQHVAAGQVLPPVLQQKHPQRIAFGLPHNYFFGSNPRGQQKSGADPSKAKLERRASPLFIHIHQGGSKPIAVLLFLPSKFLPYGSDIQLTSEARSAQQYTVPLNRQQSFWRPIHDFLERLKGVHNTHTLKRREQFTRVVEVR